MYALPKVIPINELKNTAKIAQVCKDSETPVLVTKNGYSEMVFMSVELYEKMFVKMQAATLINEGIQQLQSGKETVNAISFLEELGKRYE